MVLIAIGLAPGPLFAQHLSIDGDRFAVDGTPRFLTFISYFGAMSADDAVGDLAFLRAHGFDGVRIWVNWRTGPQLMNADGSLSEASLSRLAFVLDRARDQGLVVDLTFTAETIRGLDVGRYKAAIVDATHRLRGYDNLLFDIENERDVRGPGDTPLDAQHVADIRAAIKAIDPQRIVTASSSSLVDAQAAADFTRAAGVDVTAYHDPRDADWYRADRTSAVVAAMRSNGRPAYLQEPTRVPFPSTDRPEYFRQAIANAKLAGAAAWCLHTDLGFDIAGAGPFEQRLTAAGRPEGAFIDALNPPVTLLTANGVDYVTAEQGGGSDVTARATTPGPWETFTLIVLGGGPIVSGDQIALRAHDGVHFVQAVNGGGSIVKAVGAAAGPWETFVVEKPAGGAVNAGDAFALKVAADGLWYVCAEGGGGDRLSANRTSAGPWETFTFGIAR